MTCAMCGTMTTARYCDTCRPRGVVRDRVNLHAVEAIPTVGHVQAQEHAAALRWYLDQVRSTGEAARMLRLEVWARIEEWEVR